MCETDAGREWEREGSYRLKNADFMVRKFGQEKIFDKPFRQELLKITPHCMLRNLPDAVAIRGNQIIFIDFKTAEEQNADSDDWTVTYSSVKTMVALWNALRIPGYFFFPGDTVKSSKDVKSAIDGGKYKKVPNSAEGFFIPRSDCEHISVAIPVGTDLNQKSLAPYSVPPRQQPELQRDALLKTSQLLITRPKNKPKKDTTLFKIFLAVFAIAVLLALVWFNDGIPASIDNIGQNKPQTVEHRKKHHHGP